MECLYQQWKLKSTEGPGTSLLVRNIVQNLQTNLYFSLKYRLSVQNFPTLDLTDLTDNVVRWLEPNTESPDQPTNHFRSSPKYKNILTSFIFNGSAEGQRFSEIAKFTGI